MVLETTSLSRASLTLLGVAILVVSTSEGRTGSDGSGTITGTVQIRKNDGDRERPAVGALGRDHQRAPSETTTSLVYLEAAPKGTPEPEPLHARLDQKDETFIPHVVPVTVGSIVDFPNSDDIFHNVFSLSKPRRFDLGRYAEGQSKSVRFDTPGVVRVFCEIHSHMNAYIVVFSHRFYATTDDDGRYRIDDVPDGRHKLIVWTNGERRAEAWIDVSSGQTTKRDFTVN